MSYPIAVVLEGCICAFFTSEHDVWSNLLNLRHSMLKRNHHQFRHQIQTDGVSLSILFIRKGLKDKQWGSKAPTKAEQEFHYVENLSTDQLEALRGRSIVGCDPGKHSLAYMMDSEGNKLQYTASQRKIESYGKRSERIPLQEKKRDDVIGIETAKAASR